MCGEIKVRRQEWKGRLQGNKVCVKGAGRQEASRSRYKGTIQTAPTKQGPNKKVRTNCKNGGMKKTHVRWGQVEGQVGCLVLSGTRTGWEV